MFEDVEQSLIWTSLLIEHLTSVNKLSGKNYALLFEEALDNTNPEFSDENKLKKLIMTIQCPKIKEDRLFFQTPIKPEVPINFTIDAIAFRLLMSSMNIYLKEKENVNRQIIN